MGFFRQEYWSGLSFPSPVDPPDPGIEPVSLSSPALAGGFFITSATWETQSFYMLNRNLPPTLDYLNKTKQNKHCSP